MDIFLALQIFGFSLLVGGRPATSEAALRNYALAILNLVGIVVTLKPYRNGRRLAWYFLWYYPAS